MDFKVCIATFGAIFVAELADKTQMIGLTLSGKTGKPFAVWTGSVVAYMVVTVITVVIGALLGKYLKPDIIRYIGGALFILIGMGMLLGKI